MTWAIVHTDRIYIKFIHFFHIPGQVQMIKGTFLAENATIIYIFLVFLRGCS